MQGYIDFVTYVTASKEVEVKRGCNSFTAINKGNGLVRVNNVVLNPPLGAGLSGESFTMPGNAGEVYTRPMITVAFDTQSAPNLMIIQKVYGEKVDSI